MVPLRQNVLSLQAVRNLAYEQTKSIHDPATRAKGLLYLAQIEAREKRLKEIAANLQALPYRDSREVSLGKFYAILVKRGAPYYKVAFRIATKLDSRRTNEFLEQIAKNILFIDPEYCLQVIQAITRRDTKNALNALFFETHKVNALSLALTAAENLTRMDLKLKALWQLVNTQLAVPDDEANVLALRIEFMFLRVVGSDPQARDALATIAKNTAATSPRFSTLITCILSKNPNISLLTPIQLEMIREKPTPATPSAETATPTTPRALFPSPSQIKRPQIPTRDDFFAQEARQHALSYPYHALTCALSLSNEIKKYEMLEWIIEENAAINWERTVALVLSMQDPELYLFLHTALTSTTTAIKYRLTVPKNGQLEQQVVDSFLV